jgi:dolichyl-phosphate beta-glucosyltransferase
MTSAAPTLSLIIPAFNESSRIASPLREIGAYLTAQGHRAEIIVVDDGSDDDTGGIVREVAAEIPHPVRLLRYSENRGKGYALKVGFAAARGERILFTDADLSTPIEAAESLLAALDGGAELAIGTRKGPGAEIRLRQAWYREQMGRVFTGLVRVLLADVSDATCGFKAFQGDIGRDLFSRVRVFDWSFDAEILWIAKSRGHRLVEVPVRWEDRAGTKVSLLRDSMNSLLGLFQIRLNAARGHYDAPNPATAELEIWDRTETREPGEPGVTS